MKRIAVLAVFAVILLLKGAESRGPIQDAIESGVAAAYNKDDCTWRIGNDRDLCPDPDIHLYLYTPGNPRRALEPEHTADWLRRDYEPTRDNVILIHGYAGSYSNFLFRSNNY